jgi:hypothetical protein
VKTQSADTHPEAERVQIELLRNLTIAQRFALAQALSRRTRQLAMRAIRRANPEASEEEVRLIFVEIHYGKDLADRLRAYLSARK